MGDGGEMQMVVQKMMPVVDAGDDTGAKKQVFPAAVLTDADAGATILYGIDNHIIILLFRKEK